MTRHERLLENYEDAYFALLMEDVAQMEGARLDQLNMELQNDPHAAVPEGLTKRCLKTINAHFSNMRRSSSLRIVKKAINLAAVLIAISTLLFTSAFAISDEFRTATLNLVITANEKYTQLKMKQEDPPQESGNTMVTDSNKFLNNSSYSTDLTMELIQVDTGKVMKTWTDSGSISISLTNKPWYVTSGHRYQVKVTVTVYNTSGKSIETSEEVSSIVKF